MDSPGPNSCIIRLFPPILAYPILSSALRRLHCGLRRLHCGLRRLHCGLRRLQCGLGRLHCGLRRLYCARRRLQKSSKIVKHIFAVCAFSRRGLFFGEKYVKIFCRVCIFPQGPFFGRKKRYLKSYYFKIVQNL